MPELKTSGGSRKALVWNFRSFTISAVMVRMMPTFPFAKPASVLQNSKPDRGAAEAEGGIGDYRDRKPNDNGELAAMGVEIQPQGSETTNWAREKEATSKPSMQTPRLPGSCWHHRRGGPGLHERRRRMPRRI